MPTIKQRSALLSRGKPKCRSLVVNKRANRFDKVFFPLRVYPNDGRICSEPGQLPFGVTPRVHLKLPHHLVSIVPTFEVAHGMPVTQRLHGFRSGEYPRAKRSFVSSTRPLSTMRRLLSLMR